MNKLALPILALLAASPAMAQDQTELPPGLISARLLPGWVAADGHRFTALELQLAPGWKTYWRNPGDAGVPPVFDWSKGANIGPVSLHWPRPEVIHSGGMRSLGYYEVLVLPIEIAPATPGQPVAPTVSVDFGLCETICVPAHVELTAPEPGTDDAAISAALADEPSPRGAIAACRVEQVEDGLRLSASVPVEARDEGAAVALELAGAEVWVSDPEITIAGGRLTATADVIDASGKPFALDPAQVRMTLIAPKDAAEYLGCADLS